MIFHYNNSSIYYTAQGSGPTIVLLHGFLESSTMWEQIVPTLVSKRKIITIDFPGHGASDAIAEEHTMELFAEVVFTLLDHLQISTVTLIGHSMGGYVAMAMAEAHPERIEKLVLLNSTPAADSEERKLNRARALKLVPKAKEAFVSMAITNLFTEVSRQKLQPEIESLKTEALQMTAQGITAAIAGMKNRKDRTEVLKSFTSPKFMICGTEDPILTFQECKSIANTSDCRLFELESGHMSHLEKFQEIVKILHFVENICISS
ncbi:alpha/beta fold hydrolase [Marinirhabdus gelatinilytica]|uniref:Pimeloyl-ACP methyl ester carboxylesterase n=1 Tax=Marinirhabdus gelatinilytica TaxID=1703343 RepID=A0A370QIM9_9FLAO|nr:alpha/beta hydrolase [Marinirhabdus gelatinilytica]RDK88216.1 pimeloyl-ACP methyl ester carboxylesterase [Marinirhabdus gelatinilytica]